MPKLTRLLKIPKGKGWFGGKEPEMKCSNCRKNVATNSDGLCDHCRFNELLTRMIEEKH